MKIITHKDLPMNQTLFLGNDQICNRYFRSADGVDVQRISRWAKDGDTQRMTYAEFDAWLAEIRRIAKSEMVA